MPEYDRTDRGGIWKNDRKTQPTHPDFTGSINVGGVEYFLDAWKPGPEASDRAPLLSLRVKRKDKQPQPAAEPADNFEPDDDLPF